MNKPKVVFAYTEAGLGHIMPLNAIYDAFNKKYGDKVECVKCNFYNETNNKHLIKYENFLINKVKGFVKSNIIGAVTSFFMELFGTTISSHATMKWIAYKSYKEALKYVSDLKPDVFVSTHWATNFYAENVKDKPITCMYVPDAYINPMFSYKCDLTLCSMQCGYNKALKKKKRFNKNNLKLVPFCIREEAFSTPVDKTELRRELGLNEHKFTITLAEGGYGIGKMEEICDMLINKDLDITIIPICGKNERLYNKLKDVKSKGKLEIMPISYTPHIFKYISASNLFVGKSGASMSAEPCFFGVPQIITEHATKIEKDIASYYVKEVKSALDILVSKKVIEKIEEFVKEPKQLEKYIENATKVHQNYGAEKTADYIYNLLINKGK